MDVFFFQAEDGIRDIGVTGVQTCALPISESLAAAVLRGGDDSRDEEGERRGREADWWIDGWGTRDRKSVV